jgi:hypothetical protein
MERQPEIIDRAGRARKVEDHVDRLVNLDVLDQVVIHEEKRSSRMCSMFWRVLVSKLSMQGRDVPVPAGGAAAQKGQLVVGPG